MQLFLVSIRPPLARFLCGSLLVLLCGILPAGAQVSALKNHDVKTPVDISADKLEVRQKEDIAVFSGNVLVTQGEMTMTSDRITVFYEGQGNGNDGLSSAISRLDSSGNVTLKSPTEEITSSWGVYDLAERIITLGGQVVLKKQDGVLRGKRLQLNIDTGTISIEGGVEGEAGQDRVKGQFTIPDKK